MAIIKHPDFSHSPDIYTLFGDLFGFGGDPWGIPNLPIRHPAVNIVEKEGSIVVTAELPGILPEDTKLTLEDDVLTIYGENRSDNKAKEGGKVHWRELRYGSFHRSFALPHVDADKAVAEYKDGILTITLPRMEEDPPRAKTIAIKRPEGSGSGNPSAAEKP